VLQEAGVDAITGTSSGLGASAAKLLARHGAKVVLGARRKDRIDVVVNEISAAGGKAVGCAVEVMKLVEVEALIKGAVESFGRVDVLMNNAGIMTEGLRMELHSENIRCSFISPGAVKSELKNGTTDPSSAAFVKDLYQKIAIPADSVARAVLYAIEQPADVEIDEVVLRPIAQDF
jgi:NADP-dependent 3-hydroxy acid dehydrogenase YdfG